MWRNLIVVLILIRSRLNCFGFICAAMHRVGSSGNTSNSVRPRKEKRLTYVLSDADDTKVSCVLVFCSLVYFFAVKCVA